MTAASNASGGSLMESPIHLLHRAQQIAVDRFSEEMGAQGLTQRQYAVLHAVAAKEGLTQTELVRATGIDRSTLAEMVSRMTTRGLLARQRAKTDARANAVRLTAKGKRALSTASPKASKADSDFMSALPQTKRKAFMDTLRSLADAADAAAAPAPKKAPARRAAAKPAAKKKAPARKTAAKKPAAKKAAAKPAAKKAPARKAAAKKAPARKAAAKKAPARKTAAKKAPARKTAAKRTTTRRRTTKR